MRPEWKARDLTTGKAGRTTMRFNRLLMAGFLALVSVGTAAAAQLNSVQVTPKANTATVTLKTTGTFAHKEYRPEEHLMLVDLTGVTSDPSLTHATPMNSAVLKRYAVSTYTNASGMVVTRLELSLGDGVAADVVDASDGLRIMLTGVPETAAAAKPPVASAESKPAATPASKSATAVAAKPAAAVPAKPAVAAAKSSAASSATSSATQNSAPTAAKASSPATPAAKPQPEAAKAENVPSAAGVIKVRSVSVEKEQDAINVKIAGPSTATPYRLKNPDRLVLDFANSVMQPSVKNVVKVQSKDVLQVRVGRPDKAPTVTRVVIDLSGPREFEVVPAAGRVVVRIKTEAAEPAKPEAAEPENASAVKEPELPAKSEPAPAVAEKQAAAEAPAVKKSEEKIAAAETKPAIVTEQFPSHVPASAPAPTVASLKPAAPRQEAIPANAVAAARSIQAAALVSPKDQLSEDIAAASAAAGKPKYTGESISVNLKDVDLKDFFRLIHEISGLNVVLDPSVRGSVTLVLDDVPWDQALDIVLRNNSLDRELQGNVLRIAAKDTLRREAVDRRAQAEAVALAVDRQTITRSLSYAKSSQAVPTIKKFLTQRGDVIADERTNSLIISDIPSVLPTLDRLITQLDKKTQEVEIEVRVVSANRGFSRDIGFQLGFLWGNGPTSVGGLPNVGTTEVTDPFGTSLGNIPLFSNHPAGLATTGLGLTSITSTYRLDAMLTAAESHNLAKVLSRPRVVTQSNVKAEVKQGVKIPVSSPGTFQAGAATVAYVDAMLRLSVTPQITSDNTVFMNVEVENTQPLSNDNPPRLSTQQETTQVLVSDGGTVVIGGVMQTTNAVRVNQTPLLGDIPWLGNLFKERAVSTETNELMFFITPRIL
jgi:type IV pilus assembly protein PilQ